MIVLVYNQSRKQDCRPYCKICNYIKSCITCRASNYKYIRRRTPLSKYHMSYVQAFFISTLSHRSSCTPYLSPCHRCLVLLQSFSLGIRPRCSQQGISPPTHKHPAHFHNSKPSVCIHHGSHRRRLSHSRACRI